MAKQASSSAPTSSPAGDSAPTATASSPASSGAAASVPATGPAAAPAPERSKTYAHDPVLAAGLAAMNKNESAESSEAPGVDFESDPNNSVSDDGLDGAIDDILEPAGSRPTKKADDAATAAASGIIEKAKAAGVDESLIADLGDDLTTYLEMLGDNAPASPAAPAAENPAEAKAEQPKETKPSEQQEADVFASLRGRVDDEVLDTLQRAIDTKFSASNKTIESLQSRLRTFDEAAQSQEIKRVEQQFESAFAAVEDVFKPLIGSGATEALSPSDPAQRLRVSLAREALAFMQVQEQIGGKAPTVQEAVRTLLIAKFPNRIRLAERNAVRSAAKKANTAAVHPSNRAAPKPKNAEEALDAELTAILESV
jgi:hypothetical protein